MQAIESLIREHQTISRLADALETFAVRLERGSGVDGPDLARFAAAFTEFAECIHHEKEENILLPLLSRRGSRWETGVLPAVRRQHRQETYLIDVLRQAGERAGTWSSEDRRHIVATAKGLVEFQRSHHMLESTQLFPLLPHFLDEQDQSQLREALEKFDHLHEQRVLAAQAQIDALAARYAPQGAEYRPDTWLCAPEAAESSERGLGQEE
jgi:hemerythrin-like domain-containing protein